MGKGRAKVRAVDGAMAGGLGGVEILAAAAVELDTLFERGINEADGEERLRVAKDSGAAAKVTALVLLDLGKDLVSWGRRTRY